jgi:hypothetical protein
MFFDIVKRGKGCAGGGALKGALSVGADLEVCAIVLSALDHPGLGRFLFLFLFFQDRDGGGFGVRDEPESLILAQNERWRHA